MKVSKQARHEAKTLFRACQTESGLDEARVRVTVQLLIERKPRQYLPILTHFKRLVKLELDRRTARVESAMPLEAPLQSELEQHLTRRYGRGLQFTYQPNPALLGGARVQVGSDVYDGSVRARLEGLRRSL